MVPAMCYAVQLGDVIGEGCEVDVSAFDTVFIALERIDCAGFVVGEHAKVLRPVSNGAVILTNSYGPAILSDVARP